MRNYETLEMEVVVFSSENVETFAGSDDEL